MNRIFILPFLVFLLFGTGALSADSLPKELTTLTEQLSHSGIGPVDEQISEELEQLNDNYRKALQKAIQAEQASGNLNNILELQAEKDAIGKTIPEADSYKSDSAKRLASTYRKHLTDILRRDTELRKKLAIRFRDSMRELEASLTRSGRVEDALAVRQFLTSEEEQEKLGEALDGALSFGWTFELERGWIAALLPAEEVPRSGLWKAEELIEARRASQ